MPVASPNPSWHPEYVFRCYQKFPRGKVASGENTTLYQDDISQVEVIASQIQVYTAISQPHFKYKFIIKTDYVEFAELKGTPGLELKLPDKKTGSLSFYKIASGGSK